jgi:hypothetical protein
MTGPPLADSNPSADCPEPHHHDGKGAGRPVEPRTTSSGSKNSSCEIVRLQRQDRSLWDHEAIADACRLIARAAAHKRPGPYQLQAAIVACHAEAKRWEDTD